MAARIGTRVLLGGAVALVMAGCAAFGTPEVQSYHQATVLIEHAKGHGTGTIIGHNQVLTALHVVQDQPLELTFFDGEESGGRIDWFDERLDLALISVDVPIGYPTPELACGDLERGQHLMSIGHPMQSRWVAVGGHLPEVSTVADGVGLVSMGFPIGLGTSGGPVFDDDGRVAGVTLAILAERSSESAAYDQYKDTGIGLMLPAKAVCRALTDG